MKDFPDARVPTQSQPPVPANTRPTEPNLVLRTPPIEHETTVPMKKPTRSRRARTAGSLLLGAAGLALALQSFAPPIDNALSVATTPGPLSPGAVGTITVTGDPGDWVLVMIDTELGGSSLPFAGGIPITLGQSGNFLMLFRINHTGTITFSCGMDCEDEDAFGIVIYVQATSRDPATKEICVSNVANISWEADGSCSPEGCTPGYWRQWHHFDSWTAPYTPSTPFSDVFDDAFPGKTLSEVANNSGGALDTLGFHTVAALLNAASPEVNFAFTTQEVIDKFNAVYPGTDDDYNDLKDEFDEANNAGCPLN